MEAQRNAGKLIGVATGIFDLDEALGGFHDSDLIIVGARPAMGKTGFLLGATATATAADAKGGAVGLISGEQPANQVGLRWLAAGSGVNVGRLRAGNFRHDDVGSLLHAAEQYGALPVRIHDRPSPDITEVVREARRWKHQLGIRALYVDYLKRIEIASMSRAPKRQQVGSITRSLKNLARDRRIPVVALAQVSREADGERPQMKHLADSSEIEKEADQIMMLWRDLSNPQAERTAAEINVMKNRHGNIGVVPVTWHGGSTSYVNRSAADELGEVAAWPSLRQRKRSAPSARRPIYLVAAKLIDPNTGELVGALVLANAVDRRQLRDRKFRVDRQIRGELKQPREEWQHRLIHKIGHLMVDNVEGWEQLDAQDVVKHTEYTVSASQAVKARMVAEKCGGTLTLRQYRYELTRGLDFVRGRIAA